MLLGKSSKQINTEKSILVFQAHLTSQPPWRNRLARSAVNRKVGGSSPPGGESFCKPTRGQHIIFARSLKEDIISYLTKHVNFILRLSFYLLWCSEQLEAVPLTVSEAPFPCGGRGLHGPRAEAEVEARGVPSKLTNLAP